MKNFSAYCLKNGILYINGKASFGIGSHYYPSYHPHKVPVPEDGDRLGEMKRDFADMKAAHINVVRTAAIGDFTTAENGVNGSFPLGKSIAEELEKCGMALFVRLNGYYSGLNNYHDEKMVDEKGQPLNSCWSQFITNSVCHKQAKADNEKVTAVGADYFGNFNNVVGFQIYNEPALPCNGFYDYNPSMLEEYKKYRTEKGENANLQPPRRRPYYDESPKDWIDWRIFNFEKFNGYLNDLAAVAKKSQPKAETFTCMTCCPVQIGSTMRGADYFRIAEKMDLVGMTLYLDCKGAFYYEHARVMDYAESAAAIFKKHFWLIEYNAKTDMSARDFEVETYAAIGSGAKGIMYYQWRGDYVFDNSPEPNGYGMLYNDLSKTQKYDKAMKMHEMLYRLSDKLVTKERVRQGIGILHSEYANAYYDAICNGDNKDAWSGKENSIFASMRIYRKFKRKFVSLNAVRAKDLSCLPFKLNALIVPVEKGISKEEQEEINEFVSGGGKVFYYDEYLDAFKPFNFTGRWYTTGEIVDMFGEKIASVSEKKVDLKFLEDEDEYLISIIDFAEDEREIYNLKLTFNAKTSAKTAKYICEDKETELEINDEICGDKNAKTLTIPKLISGGIILIKK